MKIFGLISIREYIEEGGDYGKLINTFAFDENGVPIGTIYDVKDDVIINEFDDCEPLEYGWSYVYLLLPLIPSITKY